MLLNGREILALNAYTAGNITIAPTKLPHAAAATKPPNQRKGGAELKQITVQRLVS